MDRTFNKIFDSLEILLGKAKRLESRPVWVGARYAEMYVYSGAVPEAILNGVVYTKSTAWTTDGAELVLDSDVANDRILISKTGLYLVNVNLSFSAATALTLVTASVFLDNVQQYNLVSSVDAVVNGNIYTLGMSGFIEADTAGVDLDLRFRHDQGSPVNITLVHGCMNVVYINRLD